MEQSNQKRDDVNSDRIEIQIDPSKLTEIDLINNINHIFRSIYLKWNDNKKIDYQISNHLNMLVDPKNKDGYFTQLHVDWIYQNYDKVFYLLKQKNAKDLFVLLLQNEINENTNQSMSKMRQKLKMSQPTFLKWVSKFIELNLVIKMQNNDLKKPIVLNLEKHKPIIKGIENILINF